MFSLRQIYMSGCLGYQHQAQRLTIATLTSRRVADRDGGCVPDTSSLGYLSFSFLFPPPTSSLSLFLTFSLLPPRRPPTYRLGSSDREFMV